jgi:circadian clock protein KaiC
LELNGERNRCIYVLKSRGMAHSNQLREFVITSNGIKLLPPYIGQAGVLTGSSRVNQEAKELAEAVQREAEDLRREQEMERRRLSLQAQVASLQAELAVVDREVATIAHENQARQKRSELDRANLARSRRAD